MPGSEEREAAMLFARALVPFVVVESELPADSGFPNEPTTTEFSEKVTLRNTALARLKAPPP
jgi:hypothetical protein